MIELSEFALTDVQKRVVELKGSSTYRQISAELGLTMNQVERAFRTVKARAERQGFSPQHDMTRPVPDSHLCKGVSTYYNEDGKVTGQWVKSTLDQRRLEELARIISQSTAESVKPIKPRKLTKRNRDPELVVWYPVSDAHIGLYCWEAESQGNWDCKMAQEVIHESFSHVLHNSPSSQKAVVANLGDWFHTDNPKNVTNASGHQLDVDTRWAKIADVGIRTMIKLINSCLLKHETVHVINEKGNHDENSSYMMTLALDAWYRNEPRVTIDKSPDVFHYYEFGRNFFGTHHGHIVRKPESLYRIMCEDRRQEHGRCDHHYWMTGHVHHESVIDIGSMSCKSFNTIIPGDSFSHQNGYRAKRGQQAVTFHAEHGECSSVQYLVKSR